MNGDIHTPRNINNEEDYRKTIRSNLSCFILEMNAGMNDTNMIRIAPEFDLWFLEQTKYYWRLMHLTQLLAG